MDTSTLCEAYIKQPPTSKKGVPIGNQPKKESPLLAKQASGEAEKKAKTTPHPLLLLCCFRFLRPPLLLSHARSLARSQAPASQSHHTMSIWDSNKGKYDPNLERDQLVFLQQRRYTDVQRGNRKFSREMTALDHESGDQEVVRCVCVCRVTSGEAV